VPAFRQRHTLILLWGSMFRLLLWSVRSGTHRFIAVLFVMSMAATGVVITIVTDSIAFPVSVGTAASARPRSGLGVALYVIFDCASAECLVCNT
jgi:hypothetical protein